MRVCVKCLTHGMGFPLSFLRLSAFICLTRFLFFSPTENIHEDDLPPFLALECGDHAFARRVRVDLFVC